jgi:hypothetical protein
MEMIAGLGEQEKLPWVGAFENTPSFLCFSPLFAGFSQLPLLK